MLQFSELGLPAVITRALDEVGYTTPTEVQAQSIPAALKGADLLVSAQTGSGKTASFLLPALAKLSERTDKPGKGPRILVLTPTRELAQQIEKNAQTYAAGMRWMRTACLVGGQPFGFQTRALSRPVDLIVATPGRLMDHMRQGRIDFSRLEMLVLDEADRMLDMGFIEDIETIVAATPESRQTLLFSATLDGNVGRLARELTRNPERIEIARQESGGNITEHLMYADDMRHKERLLDAILKDSGFDQAVVFTATKVSTEEIADKLSDMGYAAACLHGDMPQSWRNRTLNDLRRGRVRILVATDVAARGIDVPTITHVVNFDLPKQAEDYVHRIGRTGRAGRDGTAITLADTREYHKVRRIEQYLKRTLTEGVIEGLEPTRRIQKGAPRRNGGGGGGNGRRYGSGGGYGNKSYGSNGNGGGYGRREGGNGGYGRREGGNGGDGYGRREGGPRGNGGGYGRRDGQGYGNRD
ncbi:superfamily II DNA/RNA helicase [Crenobacter luteus]|uniref:DEAD/DEAH box helicase n=1 Tax=Crenobacter luteus TaxID=1452487 RepID=UPI0010E3F521|nr:DEAD/DEAH box helicase [Crenobacter luteus]TCP11249.1 superfamily II DNA/RNA helicase [Crenobacter luteus]